MPPTKPSHEPRIILINEEVKEGDGGWVFHRVVSGKSLSRVDVENGDLDDVEMSHKEDVRKIYARLEAASRFVFIQLYPTKDYKPAIPIKKSLTFVIEYFPDGGVAYTTNGDDDGGDSAEIHINTGYIVDLWKRYDPPIENIVVEKFDDGEALVQQPTRTTAGDPTPTPIPPVPKPSPPPPPKPTDPILVASQIRNEILGVIYHELVHVWQNNALGTCPGGLIEGIADFVRWQSGYVPPHWQRKGGKHLKWDSAYDTTAFFLIWCEATFHDFSVSKVNARMAESEWDEWTCFLEMCEGETSMDSLWKRYCVETLTWP